MTEITVKAEATFYAELVECPRDVLASTPGLTVERRGLGTYLVITDALLTPGTLFAQYLADTRARGVFGVEHPLFQRAAVAYHQGRPVRLEHMNTRLLLAFLEVQLGLGFHNAALAQHQEALRRILAGGEAELTTNYYEPFAHQDNVGIHYVRGRDQQGSGYRQADWDLYVRYAERAMECAFALAPAEFGGTKEGLVRARAQFPQYVAHMHDRDGSLVMVPIRHWSAVVTKIMRSHGVEAAQRGLIRHPWTEEPMSYVPFLDGLLDMPYQSGATITFQSICGSR